MKNTESENHELFQDEKPENRQALLAANAHSKETQIVRRGFTPEELTVFKEDYSQLGVDHQNKVMAAAAEIKRLRAEINLVKQAMDDRLNKIKTRYEETQEEVYLFDDQDARKMRIYNKLGHVVNERPLLPHERQTRIVPMSKTGTNG